jgi:hypothetical protein
MVTLKKTDYQEYELIPEGEIVEVIVSDIKPHSFTYDGQQINKLNWSFMISEDGPWKGKKLRGQTSDAFNSHPNCKAYNWAKNLSGTDYPDGYELDTDTLIGLRGRAFIQHTPDKKDDQKVWVEVREVAPARRQSQRPVDSPF